MAALAKVQSAPDASTPLDVIFSCCVCNATFSEVYNGQQETVKGLSDGVNSCDRIVTRLYLTSCCHLTCSKHLQGGAPTFHPAGSRPRAPCPVCSSEGGDHQPRELYSIRGFQKGEYDAAIPECWFVTPPVNLDAEGQDMEALRFHYVSLVRFTKNILGNNQQVKGELAETQHNIGKLQAVASGERAKVVRLEKEVERLQSLEAELSNFRSRMPAIEHYLKLIPKLADQNDQMKRRLASLGFQMPLEPLPVDDKFLLDTNGLYHNEEPDAPQSPFQQASAASLARDLEPHSNVRLFTSGSIQDRPTKRPRVDSPLPDWKSHGPQSGNRGIQSRDLMPPPSKPLSKMRSIKKLWPTFRRNGRSRSPAFANGQVDITDTDPGINHGQRVEMNSSMDQAMSVEAASTPFASRRDGMLYLNRSPVVAHGTNPGSSPGASLSSRNLQALPTEPSYLRLMDGLSQDSNLHLGLKDPRLEGLERRTSFTNGSGQTSETVGAKRWGLGHAFLHQSPNNTSPAAQNHIDPLRSNPFTQEKTSNSMQTAFAPATPVNRQHTFGQFIPGDSVVSPFFKSKSQASKTYSREGGVTEQQRSSRRSGAYQSPRITVPPDLPDWRSSRSLNGLSFFQSPLNTKHESINGSRRRAWPHDHAPSPVHQTKLYSHHQGFDQRPGTIHSTSRPNFTGNSLDYPFCARHRETSSHSMVSPASVFHDGRNRIQRLPSATPSVIPGTSSPVRPVGSQWKDLAQVGIRSSQKGRTLGYGSSPPGWTMFPDARRRSVRR